MKEAEQEVEQRHSWKEELGQQAMPPKLKVGSRA